MRERVETRGGITTMLPSDDALVVGEELSVASARPSGSSPRRPPTPTAACCGCAGSCRSVRTSSCSRAATTARWTRATSCWTTTAGRGRSRATSGRRSTRSSTTKVVEYNDADALEEALAPRDVACVLMEPAMTNIGIVPPLPGYLEEVRRLCDETGTLLVNDETHTWSAGRAAAPPPGACARYRHPRQDARVGGADRRLRRLGGARRADPRRPRGRLRSTGAASAARSPATRSRAPPRARRSRAC